MSLMTSSLSAAAAPRRMLRPEPDSQHAQNPDPPRHRGRDARAGAAPTAAPDRPRARAAAVTRAGGRGAVPGHSSRTWG